MCIGGQKIQIGLQKLYEQSLTLFLSTSNFLTSQALPFKTKQRTTYLKKLS